MNRPFVGLLLTLFAGGVAATPIRTLLPAYIEEVLQQPPLLTSLLLAIQLGTGGLFALFAGALAARAGQRAVVLAGLTTPLAGALLLFLQAPPLLVLGAILWGIAAGFHSAGGQSFMIAAVRRERLGSASALYFLSSTAAGAAGAYTAGLIAEHVSYTTVAALSATLGLLSLTLATWLLPSLDSTGGPGGTPPAGPGQSPGERERSSQKELGVQGSAASPAGGASAPSYTTLLHTPEILLLCLLRYLPTFAWGIASLTIPLLIFRLSHNSPSTLGAYGTISLLCAGAAQLATGRLTDLRHGEVRPLLAPLTAAIVCAALLTAAAIWTESLLGLIAAGTLWTMAAWALSTTMPPLIRALGGPAGSDRLVGLAHTMWSAGMLSGTLAAGALIDLSPVAPILVALICLSTALICAIWVNARRLQPAPA